MVDDRQWNTCQAALRFWAEVQRTSRTPPRQHPAVRPFFEDGRPSPLTLEEIEKLIDTDPVGDRNLGYPIRTMMKYTGHSIRRLRDTLARLGLRPSGKAGRTGLYPWGDLRKAADRCHEWDFEHGR